MSEIFACIQLAIEHSKMKRVADAFIVERTVRGVKCSFDFKTDDWDTLGKTAVFIKENTVPPMEPVAVLLDSTNTCYVPSEVLAYEGQFSVGVYGVQGTTNTIILPTNLISFKVNKGCVCEGVAPADPTPSIYIDLLTKINANTASITAINTYLNNLRVKNDDASGSVVINNTAANDASGDGALAVNGETKASGNASLAAGWQTEASGTAANARGYKTKASGVAAEASGIQTTASGNYSEAHGVATTASGQASTTFGTGTKASGGNQFAIGKYNVDNGNNLVTVGNGTDNNNRKNLVTLKNNGDLFIKGKVLVESSDNGDSGYEVAKQSALNAHTGNTNNPHSVTKAQVGLGNVDNTSDADKPVSTATQAAITAHTSRTDNPHSVTKAQVGLGNVDNTSDADKPVSTATQTLVSAHTSRTDNPHSVTKAQVGLGNVDNTSDLAKPISTATQTALNAKVSGVTINGTSIVEDAVAKIVYETGLGSDTNNAATTTAIRAYVNSSIEAVAAYYVTYDIYGNAFPTNAALNLGPWYYAGSPRTPTRNDYAIVVADETHQGKTARYTYTYNQWAFQYTFNMSFTQAQIDAINSGINSTKVAAYEAHLANTSNPHSVTKAQVGLGNVDNTSDLNKPVSDATRAYAQEKLASGTNIKTINGESILGAGNLNVSGLPQATTAGTAAIFNGTSWTAQTGYGYETTVDGVTTVTPIDAKYTSNIKRVDVTSTTPDPNAIMWIDTSASSSELYQFQVMQTTGTNTDKVMSQNAVTEALAAKYTKPVSGIPASDIASGVIPSVSVSASGTATDEVQYITINGVEKKLAGGGNDRFSDVVFTITSSGDDYTVTATKTVAEVMAMLTNNQVPLAKIVMGSYVLYGCIYLQTNRPNFSATRMLDGTVTTYYVYGSNGSWRADIEIKDFVNLDQGVENAGKFLAVGADGEITLVDPPAGGNVNTATSVPINSGATLSIQSEA